MNGKNYVSSTSIPQHSIVKAHASNGTVQKATAATDKIFGVSAEISTTSGQRVDVLVSGIVEVRFGAAAKLGDLLTSDTKGKAIPTSTTGNIIIGVALQDAEADEIGLINIAVSKLA